MVFGFNSPNIPILLWSLPQYKISEAHLSPASALNQNPPLLQSPNLCRTSNMHLPTTISLLLTLLPSTLAAHSTPFPFPFRFNTTGATGNLTLPPTPLRLPAWHPWIPGPSPWTPNPSRDRNRGRPWAPDRRRPGRIFTPMTPSNTTLTTLPTMVPPVSLQSYRVSTGSISCSSSTGLISKTPGGANNSDTTALVSFQLPGEARGRTCQLFFYLPGGAGNMTALGNMTAEAEVAGSGTSIHLFCV